MNISQKCKVSVAQHKVNKTWVVVLEYADGSKYASNKKFNSEEEAKAAAYQFIMDAAPIGSQQ